MKRFALMLCALFALAPFAAAVPPEAASPKLVLKTGAKPSSPKSIASAPRFQRSGKIGAPSQFARVPTRLSMWGNSQFGCCVTSEECAAKIAANPHVFITEQTAIRWASQHGVLNGAELADVLDMMARDGITAEDGTVYRDGPKLLVDLTDKAALAAAIFQGPVKIALASNQVMDAVNGTGGKSGWYGVNWQRDPNTDHCTGLLAYGPASFCYDALKLPLPAGVDPTTYGYLMFTWNSLGFVSHDSLMNVAVEGWTRQPTTAGYPEPQPAPVPAPQPTPAPQPAPAVRPIPVIVYVAAAGVIVLMAGGVVIFLRTRASA